MAALSDVPSAPSIPPRSLGGSINRGRLVLLGHPALSPVESIGSPNSEELTTPTASGGTGGRIEDYLTARVAKGGEEGSCASPLMSGGGAWPQSFMEHIPLNNLRYKSSNGDLRPEYATRLPVGGGDGESIPASHLTVSARAYADIRRRSTFMKFQPFTFSSSTQQPRSVTPSPSSSTDSLWGTPVDATAIKMGLVDPPPQALSPAASPGLESATAHGTPVLSEYRERSSGSTIDGGSSLPAETSLHSNESGSTGTAGLMDAAGSSDSSQVDILHTAEAALCSDGDALGAVRRRAMADLRLLLAKALQRHCDVCEEGTGLWIWTWSSQVLCLSCVAVATQAVSEDVKEALLAKVSATASNSRLSSPLTEDVSTAVDTASEGEKARETMATTRKDVDRPMLSRICNSLPQDALHSLIQANRRPSALSSEAGQRRRMSMTAPSSPGEDSFLDLSSSTRSSSFLRGTFNRIANMKAYQMRGGIGSGEVTSGEGRGTSRPESKLWTPPSPTHVRDAAGPTRKPSKRSSTRPARGGAGNVDTSNFENRMAPLPKLPASLFTSGPGESLSNLATPLSRGIALPSPTSSVGTHASTVESVLSRKFRLLSTIFIGMLSTEQHSSLSNGELGDLHVFTDEAFVCTLCPSSSDHPSGMIVLGSERRVHVGKFHPRIEPEWLLIGPDREEMEKEEHEGSREELDATDTSGGAAFPHMSTPSDSPYQLAGEELLYGSPEMKFKSTLHRRSRSQPFSSSSSPTSQPQSFTTTTAPTTASPSLSTPSPPTSSPSDNKLKAESESPTSSLPSPSNSLSLSRSLSMFPTPLPRSMPSSSSSYTSSSCPSPKDGPPLSSPTSPTKFVKWMRRRSVSFESLVGLKGKVGSPPLPPAPSSSSTTTGRGITTLSSPPPRLSPSSSWKRNPSRGGGERRRRTVRDPAWI